MTNLALAWLLLGAQATASEGEILKFTPVENQENKYKLDVKLKYNNEDIIFTADLGNRVVQIMEDGSFVVASSQKNSQLMMNGTAIKSSDPSPTFTTYTKLGHTSSITGDDINSEDYRFANLTALIWPNKPIKNDEVWTVDVKGDAETGAISTRNQYRLLAQEELLGRKCHKISFDITEVAGSKPASSKGIVWVDRITGFTVKVAAELKQAPLADTQVDAVMEMTLVPLT